MPFDNDARQSFNKPVANKVYWTSIAVLLMAAFVLVVTRFGGRVFDEEAKLWFRISAVWAGISVQFYAYIAYLTRLAEGQTRPRFTLRGIFWQMSAVAVISAVGYAVDAVVLLAFLGYAFVIGPVAKRLLVRWMRKRNWRNNAILCAISGCIVGSFVTVATLVFAGIMLITPRSMQIDSEVMSSMMFPSAAFAYLVLLGDNAQSATQLILYGLPAGLPINLVFGVLTGILAGKVAMVFSRFCGRNKRTEVGV
jgi:hypothetical protein